MSRSEASPKQQLTASAVNFVARPPLAPLFHFSEDERATLKIQFLEIYDQSFNLTAASRATGVALSTLYTWRREDEEFDRAWKETYLAHVDRAEEALMKMGLDENVNPRARVTALLGVLNAHRASRYAPQRRAEMENAGKNVTFQLILGKAPDEQLAESSAPTVDVFAESDDNG